jgi:O-antigen ligase
MDTPDMMRDMRTDLELGTRPARIPVSGVVLFAFFFSVGSLAVLYPSLLLGCIVAAAVLVLVWLAVRHIRRNNLDAWQVILLIALTGYLILNYGFENLTIHVGFPIIISYVLMFVSLGLAVFTRSRLLMIAVKEPTVLCLLALLLLTFLHLVLDVPAHGLWALRDATLCFDGIFLTLGLLWAMRGNSTVPLMKWLTIVFFLNSIYSLGLPLSDRIMAWSPKSGVFLPVPLFGSYHGNNAICLLIGALFYMSLAHYVVRWPRWIILFLAMLQLFGLAIHQARALYVGLGLVLIIFVLLGETGKAGKLLLLLSPAIIAVLLITALGIEIEGRIGPVRADFFREHVRSISGAEGTPGSSLEGRMNWYDDVLQHIRSHPVVGEGFGTVLVDALSVDDTTGAAVRHPHNSSIDILARLGLIGLLPWVVFHLLVLKGFVDGFRRRRYCDEQMAEFILWLFVVYVIFMIEASVEGVFEVPSGSIPFYFFVGLALGLIRWRVPQRREKQLPKAACMPANSVV